MKGKRVFRARIRPGSEAFNLICDQCGTVEELPEGDFPHDAAMIHAQWFHRGPIRVPQGWQKAKG
jgi:Fe2+ or Zn2+ uptake regulation protein